MNFIEEIQLYADHRRNCQKRTANYKEKCNCGYDKFIRNLKKVHKKYNEFEEFIVILNQTLTDKNKLTLIEKLFKENSDTLLTTNKTDNLNKFTSLD